MWARFFFFFCCLKFEKKEKKVISSSTTSVEVQPAVCCSRDWFMPQIKGCWENGWHLWENAFHSMDQTVNIYRAVPSGAVFSIRIFLCVFLSLSGSACLCADVKLELLDDKILEGSLHPPHTDHLSVSRATGGRSSHIRGPLRWCLHRCLAPKMWPALFIPSISLLGLLLEHSLDARAATVTICWWRLTFWSNWEKGENVSPAVECLNVLWLWMFILLKPDHISFSSTRLLPFLHRQPLLTMNIVVLLLKHDVTYGFWWCPTIYIK